MKFRLTGVDSDSKPVTWLMEAASAAEIRRYARGQQVEVKQIEVVAKRGAGAEPSAGSAVATADPASKSGDLDATPAQALTAKGSDTSFELDLSESAVEMERLTKQNETAADVATQEIEVIEEAPARKGNKRLVIMLVALVVLAAIVGAAYTFIY